MPTVTRLSMRAPCVCPGLGLPASEIDLTEQGVLEDRRFFLTDAHNRLVDRLHVGPLVQVSARTDPDATVLRLTFPDGRVVEDDVRLADAIETPIHGRTGVGHVVDGPFAAALGAFLRPGRDPSSAATEPAGRASRMPSRSSRMAR